MCEAYLSYMSYIYLSDERMSQRNGWFNRTTDSIYRATAGRRLKQIRTGSKQTQQQQQQQQLINSADDVVAVNKAGGQTRRLGEMLALFAVTVRCMHLTSLCLVACQAVAPQVATGVTYLGFLIGDTLPYFVDSSSPGLPQFLQVSAVTEGPREAARQDRSVLNKGRRSA